MNRTPLIITALLIAAAVVIIGSAPARAESDVHHFTILHTNDEHSALLPHSPSLDYDPEGRDPTVGGFARLAGALQTMRGEIAPEEPVLVISAGDFMAGTPFAWLALEGKAAELDLMQHMGYDLVILGNHEYDYGPDVLTEYLEAAGYPGAHEDTQILSGNAAFPAGHPLVQMQLKMTTVISPAGLDLDIGFFSLLGENAIALSPNADPVQFEEPLQFATKAVARLKEEGADIIVGITHSGLPEDEELAREVAGIDVIVGGHCHTALHEPLRVEDTIIVQAGAHTEYLGCLQLTYDAREDSLTIRDDEPSHPHLLPIDDDIEPCPDIESRIAQYTEAVNRTLAQNTDGIYDDLLQVVAYSSDEISNLPKKKETPYGNLIADAFRWSVQQRTGDRVDFAFQANGQIRGPLLPGNREETRGQLSLYEVLSTMGMGHGPQDEPGYPLVSIYLTGDEVRRVLEISHLLSQIMGDAFFLQVSGLRFSYDPGRAILLQLPVVDQPLPTYRAVLEAERYLGDDPKMSDDFFEPLKRGDEDLYHVVADTFVASFIPMVGDMLPRLEIKPRDSTGHPIQDLNARIIDVRGEPLTGWRAVADYLQSMPAGDTGVPEVPELYAGSAGRQVEIRTVSLLVWPISGIFLLAGCAGYVVMRRIRRRRDNTANPAGRRRGRH